MMNEELQQLSSSANGLLEQEAGAAALRRLRSEAGSSFDRNLWQKMSELGWAGLAVSEEQGGYGMGIVGAATLGEALGSHLAATPFSTSAVLASRVLAAAQLDIGELVSGSTLVSVPLDTGSRPKGPGVMAYRSGDGFRLKGKLQHLSFFGEANKLLLWAQTSDNATTAFLLPTDGLSPTSKVQVDMLATSSVQFDDAEVDSGALVGTLDEGDRLLSAGLDSARVVVAAEMMGLANAVFQQTLTYLKDRKQFGVAIGSFQALQHRAANLHIELAIAGAVVRKAAASVDKGDENAAALVSAAKAKAGQVAMLAGNEAIQMHGGVGVTDEYDVGLFVKRIRSLESAFGDSDFHTDRCAIVSGY